MASHQQQQHIRTTYLSEFEEALLPSWSLPDVAPGCKARTAADQHPVRVYRQELNLIMDGGERDLEGRAVCSPAQ